MREPGETVLLVLVVTAGVVAIFWVGMTVWVSPAPKAGEKLKARDLTDRLVSWLLAAAIFVWMERKVSPTGMWEHVLLVTVCSTAGIVLNGVIERYLQRRAEAARPDDEQAGS